MPSVTLTRRGRVVVGVVVLAVLMALAAGGRTLNAVVLSGGVALVAGYVQVVRIDPPRARRHRPADGHVGETRTVSIDFRGEAPGEPVSPPFVAAVSDRLDDGLSGPSEPTRTTVGEEPATYRIRYVDRGERRIGPTALEATDVFGLFARRMTVGGTDVVLAYPEREPIPAGFRRDLYSDEALGASRQREEFDRLREYARGDALRDVHWPTTAKRDELVVKEFAAEAERRRVSIAGRTAEGAGEYAADALARASASLAVALLDDGVPVDLTLPAGRATAEPTAEGRRDVLELAARTGGGPVDADPDCDVRVVADDAGAEFRTRDRTVSLADLGGEFGDGDVIRGSSEASPGAPPSRSAARLDGGEQR